jgi:hypothetical protein
MPIVATFYSINEASKPKEEQVHHNNSACAPGRDIKAAKEDKPGTNGYRLCEVCIEETAKGN